MSSLRLPAIHHRTVDTAGVRIFYRETGPASTDSPTVLLLHGFPSSSQQYRRLMDALGGDHRLIAPDYPGFARTVVPDGFPYSFEALTDVI
ncbi:MAG: alpha/beta fold hydrolase, partial [Catenulisporales bacterium]|nr:alpha/beta fold hydrolase [Catenulisporales bacterium]